MALRRLGRPLCTDLAVAERREWLLANGRGSYALGTVAGTLTRRYHGLLIAALDPPVARRLIVPSVQVEIGYDGRSYALSTNRWASGLRVPEGWRRIESFVLADGVPTWTYALADARLELTLAMVHGSDQTALLLRALRARAPLRVTLRLLVADRDHHGGPLPDPAAFALALDGERATVALPACRRTLHVAVPGAEIVAAGERWSGFFAERELERGLDPYDDYLHALDARFVLEPGACGGLVVGLEPAAADPASIVDAAGARGRGAGAGAPGPLLAELGRAAEQFVVRAAANGPSRTTLVAGYPWFSDWGRDTMISLPGLLLARGRRDVAEAIVRAYAPYVDGGMLPNVFPDAGSAPEYNTVDAALWYVEAIRACAAANADPAFAREFYPVVRAIIDGYTRGTRYGIVVDPRDALLRAGEPGVQLTWMDAKVGGRVVTPRIGKPVEVNALWFAALRTAAAFAARCGADATPDERAAAAVRASFGRFWNEARGCCFDVVDGPDGDDPALRPNQLFAVALAPELLAPEQARSVVDTCARELLTPVGLRTLAPGEPGYVGHYRGDQAARDGAYHQGTVWPWLLGAFVRAHLHVYRDPAVARSYLVPLADTLDGDGMGTLGEIFEGDPPHAPCGTVAQAWSVAEAISALTELGGADRSAGEAVAPPG